VGEKNDKTNFFNLVGGKNKKNMFHAEKQNNRFGKARRNINLPNPK